LTLLEATEPREEEDERISCGISWYDYRQENLCKSSAPILYPNKSTSNVQYLERLLSANTNSLRDQYLDPSHTHISIAMVTNTLAHPIDGLNEANSLRLAIHAHTASETQVFESQQTCVIATEPIRNLEIPTDDVHSGTLLSSTIDSHLRHHNYLATHPQIQDDNK